MSSSPVGPCGKSNPSRDGWAGASNGCRHTAATSIMIFTYHSGRMKIEKGVAYYNYEIRKVGTDELSGRSVFYKDANGDVFHTYSSYARGGDLMLGAYNILDLMPKGRNETGPNRNLTDWVRHHDRYDSGGHVAPTGRYV